MSEPHADPTGHENGLPAPGNGAAPLPPPTPPSDPEAAGINESILTPDVEPTDDSPTIISKVPPRHKLEDAFAVNLRGRNLAHFELIEPIGIGGMAAVIRAHDTQLDRTVALKILPPEMATDPENIRRFQQEARAAAKLDHENIARVFFCGEDQGLHFIAFEFVEGENLRTLLERDGRIDLKEAVSYMLQVATGLAHASSRGVVHRDIKPSNIIISPNGRAKLVDMGLARSLEPRAEGALTQSGVTLGTFDYISPEQALEPREADVRSDIYSLGCTLYHMITGQAPVPEGTAAKKLHYHQHVAPVDPRQLNPDIPDEVAAILARMMAKDPKVRYQRPEHLVEHLLIVARKLGTATDLPDGVLFVDAPLPNPPRVRPVVMGALAGAVVVVLVVLIHALSGPPEPVEPIPGPRVVQATPKDSAPSRPTPLPMPVVPPDPPKPAPSPVPWQMARTAPQLTDWLKQPTAAIRLAGDVNLTGTGETGGLVFDGNDLTIESDPAAGKRPTLRLAYNTEALGKQPWAALTVKKGKVLLRGVRLEIDAGRTNLPMAAVAVLGNGSVILDKCELVQAGLPDDESQRKLSGVLLGNAQRPDVTLKECLFLGARGISGQDIVTCTGPADIQAVSCAFGPHAALVHVRGPSDLSDVQVTLQNCSALLGPRSTAFRLEPGGAARFRVQDSLFSQPGGSDDGDAYLVWQVGSRGGNFFYQGQGHNCYHNLDAFWVRGDKLAEPQEFATRLEEFKDLGDTIVRESDQAAYLTASPWQDATPLRLLADNPRSAFQVNLQLAQLRRGPGLHSLVGLDQGPWGGTYSRPLPALPAAAVAAAPQVRIVDPSLPQIQGNSYPRLDQAVSDAQPGDEILIKHNGPLKVEPVVRLEKTNLEVTIRPFRGYRPVLTLGPTTDPDAALFRLYDGALHLEHLQFQLKPNHKDFHGQAVVAIPGNGLCTFKECVATLEENMGVPVALVVVSDSSQVMKMGPPSLRSAPKVVVQQTFVRGDADLIAVRSSRRFDVEIEESLVALEGSLLVIDGNPRDPLPRPAASVTLHRLTAYLNDHLVLLRSCRDDNRMVKGLVQTQISSATDCLFVAAEGKSLVHMDGMDSDEQIKGCFSWAYGNHNAYSGYTRMLDHEKRPDEAVLPFVDRSQWGLMTKEVGLFTRTRPPVPPGLALAHVTPAHFKVKPDSDLAEYGPDLDRLPVPFGEVGSSTED